MILKKFKTEKLIVGGSHQNSGYLCGGMGILLIRKNTQGSFIVNVGDKCVNILMWETVSYTVIYIYKKSLSFTLKM